MMNKQCPFCKKDNNCMVDKATSCWCFTTKVPEELIALVPKNQDKKSCICKKCIESFLQSKEAFIKIYC